MQRTDEVFAFKENNVQLSAAHLTPQELNLSILSFFDGNQHSGCQKMHW